MMPDKTITLRRGDQRLTVHLAVGDQFPWAVCNGRVVLGPPDGTHTSDGVPLDSLEWKTAPYWVMAATDPNGNEVELSPAEYAQAVVRPLDDQPPLFI